MPEESISKRLAAKLKITGKVKTINNNPTNNHISDLVNRSSSVEQKAELSRAAHANRLQSRQNIDNIQSSKSTRESTDEVDRDGSTLEKPLDQRRSLGFKENSDLQHANIYSPEGISNTTAQAFNNSVISTTSNTVSPNSAISNESNQPVLSPTDNGNDQNSDHQTTSGKPKGNPAQKAISDITKNAIKGLTKKIAANPATWPWIIAGIAILLALIILASFIGFHYARKAQVPNPDGKSLPVQVDPIADKEWVRKVLMLAGDKDVSSVMTEEFLGKLNTDLTALKLEISSNTSIDETTKASAINKIDTIIVKVDAAKSATSTQKKKLAEEIKTGLSEIAEIFYSVPVFPTNIPTHLPLDTDKFTSFNNRPHFGTPTNPCGANTKNSKTCPKPNDGPARTYIQHVQNTCDAVDFTTPNNGDTVFAVFSGKVTRNDSLAGLRVETTVDGHHYMATYAHTTGGKSVGSDVTAGEKIAVVGDGHLHFELAIDNRCVVNKPSEKSSTGMGQLLWSKMRAVLRLQ